MVAVRTELSTIWTDAIVHRSRRSATYGLAAMIAAIAWDSRQNSMP